jgi:hypothetical protein
MSPPPPQEVTSANLHSDAVVQFKDSNWAEWDYEVVVRLYGVYIDSFTTVGPAGKGLYPPQTSVIPAPHPGFLWAKSQWSGLEGNYEFCVYPWSAIYPESAVSACTSEYLYTDDADGDGYPGQDEWWWPLCYKFGSAGFADLDRDDDGDGRVNDGCRAVGNAETGAQCENNTNDDPASDPVINDGCQQVGAVSEGGAGIGTQWDDGCSGNFQSPGGPNWGWPPNLYSQVEIPSSPHLVDIKDVTSFLSPVRRYGTSPPDAYFHPRWDLLPGRGLFASWINIQDITALFAGPTAFPPMPPFSGVRRVLGGPACDPNQ